MFTQKHIKGQLTAALAGSTMLVAVAAQADQVFFDDLIVNGSICAGLDCSNGESFGFDTIRLKENNLRIHFNDTSTSASFPSNDWRIVANDTSNGGTNHLSIEDSTAGRSPFRVEAGASANALVVEADSDIGIGTLNPVVELHVVDGDSPTLRLEQNGSSGFTPQTYDLVSNEANFFIRDVTNGSQLPFRIKPGADTDALFIAANNDIGMGTDSPDKDLQLYRSSGAVEAEIESGDGSPVLLRLQTTHSTNRRVVGLSADTTVESSIHFGDNELSFYGNDYFSPFATLTAAGLSVGGTQLNVPDYVFSDDYQLMSLSEVESFIDKYSHLPNIPSAREVNENGLNMTDMQLALLRKVEELTLYTISQQEQINRLMTK